jgi:2-iminobutanoate/2-iminopropanoate deaminase
MVKKQIFDPKGQFSKAILVECKKFLFLSGEGPDDPYTDIETQTRQTFVKLQKQLAEAGASFKNIVKMTYFLVDEKDMEDFRQVRKEFIKDEPPTASLVIVKSLGSGIKLEIEGIAVF